jgi:hypothetical protein
MLAELVAAAGIVAGTWQNEPSLPLARTEVAVSGANESLSLD